MCKMCGKNTSVEEWAKETLNITNLEKYILTDFKEATQVHTKATKIQKQYIGVEAIEHLPPAKERA